MESLHRRAFMRASAGALGGALVVPDLAARAAGQAPQAGPAGEGATGPELRIGEARWENGALDDSVEDWTLFPQAYGVIASERLMHPIDVAHWPVQIGRQRQLFVDNHLVASAADVVRTVHQPVKERRNPIMQAEAEWELDKKLVLLQVLRDPESGKFRMWYTSWVRFMYPGTKTRGRMPTMYAESSDGLHWERPNLGLLEYNGSKANNWVIYGRMYGLIHDPAAKDPNRRYLATVMHEPPYRTEGVYLYGSPDGLRWSLLRDKPIVRLLKGDEVYPLDGLGDTSQFRYDPLLKLYVCDAKFAFRGPKFRTRGITTSPDLVHWSRPRMTIHPDAADGPDAQIYANVSFVYESMWLGMLRVYHDAPAGYKQVDVQLSASRDGLHWSRVARRDVFLPLGGKDSWERDYTDPAHSGPLLVGDELWFYYRGTRYRITDYPKGSKEAVESDEHFAFATGLARLRRDGFVSIDGGDKPGTVVTRPLTFDGRRLRINAAVKPGGEIRVAVLDMDGKPLPGLTADRSAPITGDSTSAAVNWAGNSDLTAARERHEHLRLAFTLQRAELYSWWIE